jgi:hypothetical protein
MRGGGWTCKARVEGADNGKAIGQQTTRREEWGGGHYAGRLGGGWHDRGGGWTTHARWWLTASGGGGRGCTQDVLKIVPQNCTSNHAKPPRKIGFFEEVFAQFEVRFDVQQILPQIVPVFV